MDGHEICHLVHANGDQAKPFGYNFSGHNNRLPTLRQRQSSANQ
jgi:hypothetical protein